MEPLPLVKKTRCPKGQTRNKQGDCVAKIEKAKKTTPTKKTTPVKKTRVVKKKSSPKTKKVKVKVNNKQLTNNQLIELMKQRRKCIERFRNKT